MTDPLTNQLGFVVEGSLSGGLEMRLNPDRNAETLRVGTFAVIEGDRNRYFAMLEDIRLKAADSAALISPPKGQLAKAVLQGIAYYTTATMKPMLMIDREASADDPDSFLPVKSIPPHFSEVHEASSEDIQRVFGSEEKDKKYFELGRPLDMETPICLNLDRWVERSNAIFGKSGTGKTFLTKLALCGVIKANKAVNLIFDMHNEYGWKGSNEGPQDNSPGIKYYFPDTMICSLDRASSDRRGGKMDYEVKIPYSAVESGDILLLQKEFNLPATSGDSVHILQRELKHDWLEKFLAMKPNEIKDFAEESGAHAGALDAFHRRMSLLCSRCSTFLMKKADVDRNAVEDILGFLQSGKNVVLEFGGQNHPGQYMLVANILSRRIHDMYVKLVEEAENGNKSKPPQLIITIEEAHKFLAPGMADQTIFGTIARELRKYRVTLLIVDQRPSGIDDEVLSQVGTKICCLLDDDRDISAVLTGTLGASGLKSVLTSLDSKQQAIIFGHAVPMPVVVRTRTYGDNDFRDRMGHRELTSEQRQMAHQKLKDESY